MRRLSLSLMLLLIPLAHAQEDFGITNHAWNGLSELYEFTKKHYRVEIAPIGVIDDPLASEKKIIVMLHPVEKLPPEKLYSYVSRGGRVLVADDFGMGNGALGRFGLSFAGDKVSCGGESSYSARACCPEITEFEPHRVTVGVERIVSNYPTAIQLHSSKSFRILARFPSDCFYDLNYNGERDAGEREAGGAAFLLVYTAEIGRMVVISDPSIFINEMLSRGDNKRLYKNILNWLSESDYSYTIVLLDKDKDGDGLSDAYEELFTGTDPERYDTDGDGTADGLEDLDNDGLNNIGECRSGTNPRNPDTDGDGIYDGTDIEPAGRDSDNDGLSDSYERRHTFTDPYNPDTDGNGIADGNEDFDADGLTNLEEQRLGTNPKNPDTDGDGIYDNEDAEPLSKDVAAELLKFLFFNQPLFLALLAFISALMGSTYKPAIKSFFKKPSLAMSEFTRLVRETTKSRNYTEPAYYLGREFLRRIQEKVEVPEPPREAKAGMFSSFVDKILGLGDPHSEKLAEILAENYPDLDRKKVYKLIKRLREIVNAHDSKQRKIQVSEREMKHLYITAKEVLKIMGVDMFERGLRQGKRGV